jgi:GT2 family glycosyltransferase
MTSLDVSIIVVSKVFPNINIQAFLDSTKLLTVNYEMIIITHKILSSNRIFKGMLDSQPNLAKVKLVLLNQEVDSGPAHDRNVGAKLAESSNILFADDDTIFLEDIKELVHHLQIGNCAGLQPLLLRSPENGIVDSAGDFIWKSGPTYRPYSRCSKESLKTLSENLCVEEVPSMKSALMLVRKDAFFAVGGFDSSFNFNFEDVDLGWRMTCAGFKLLFVPSIKALHKGGRVSSGLAKKNEVLQLGIVNFYVSHFKMRRYRSWPSLFACFQFEFVIQSLFKNANCPALVDFFRDIFLINALLLNRIRLVRDQRKSLTCMQFSPGTQKFEEMARGKRFILQT